GHGVIRGVIQGGAGIGVLGAHVQAISRRTGEVIGVISDENGEFEIAGLDYPDSYYLYISPIKNLESLPAYYSNVQNKFCPAAYVGTFFTGCGKEDEGFPHAITIQDLEPVDVGVVSIGCSLKSNEEYNHRKLQEEFTPLEIWGPQDGELLEKAFVGHFRSPSNSSWSNY